MRAAQQVSRQMIEKAARLLAPLGQQVVFLGGAAMALLITDPAAPDVRVTEDVDVIVEIASRSRYYRLEERLRELGFTQSREEQGVICRWQHSGLKIDIMPTEENILTFGNRWYAPAMKTAQEVQMAGDLSIHLITVPYFLATKIDAFRSGSRGDLWTSRDMQDIVSLLDGRPEAVAEVQASEPEVRTFLAVAFKQFGQDEEFADLLPGLLNPDDASQARLPLIQARIQQISGASAP